MIERRYVCIPTICAAFACAALQAQTSRLVTTRPAGILVRNGERLLLDGRPFRSVGVNKYELLVNCRGPCMSASAE